VIRFIFVFTGAIGLILLMAFVAARLARVRTEGISVRLQIFIALAFIVGAFSFGLGLLVLDRIEARATRIAKEAANDEAGAIATFVAGQIDATGTSLQDIVKVLEFERQRGSPARSRLALYDATGRELFFEGHRPDQPGTVAVRAAIQTRSGVVGHVQVVKETVIMRRLLADFAPIVFLISAILGAAAALAAALIGREIAAPIESLTYFAERVSEGDRSVTPPVPHGLEVKKLTKAIDKMRRELDGLPYVESFAADLSHELKNPVAAIRASAEVLDEGALAEPEEAQRFVRRIREATSRIEAILSELLSLARIESRGIENPDALELVAIVRSAIEANASRGKIDLEEPGSSLRVRGDRTWLSRALGNLVNNALTHGDGSQTPRIVISSEEGNAVVSVSNPGVVPPHIRKRLFRRFVTSRGDKGGTGLGLPIVRAIAEAHRGKVEVEFGDDDVTFRLVLPRA
jgi:two-component system, OmpR family, sensor histidine kinase CreC